MIDLAIIIVNWNVRSLLRRCLASIYDHAATLRLQVIVVDNDSSDGSTTMVRQTFPQVHLIANTENQGFTRGNNQALRALGFHPTTPVAQPIPPGPPAQTPPPILPRYVLLLNPDTEIVGDALQRMVAYMDEHPNVGVLGPQLRYPDGTIQSSRRRFPTLATAFWESTLLQQWWPHNPFARRYHLADRPDDETQDVDWVVGACMLVRRAAIEKAGLLDETFFMYSEELDWCRRIKQQGWRIVYFPAARVVHHEGKSSEQVVPTRHIHFQRSKIRYFRKYHGLLPATLLQTFLLSTYAVQLGIEAAKWVLGHKRPLRRERIWAYWQVLRSGL